MAFGSTQSEAASRSALIDVLSYDIQLDLVSDPGSVRSRTEIRFSCREPGASSYADLSADTVHRAELNGQALDSAGALSDGRLHLPGLASGNILTVDAESGYRVGDPDLSRFTDPADGSQFMLATCDATSAPRLFCCFNQRDLRADLTLSVTAPPGWECVSHGAVTARPEPGQAGVWRFATVPAMKPSDVSLCAGPYVAVAEANLPGTAGPIPLSVRCRRSLAREPGLARIADTVSRSLVFYERLLGVPCPYPKYDVVFAPALAAGAMQDAGLMLVSEKHLQRAADPADDSVALTLAHEVAHLWFGSLVTPRWWDDLWLGEALADYLSYTAGDEALDLPEVWARYGMRSKPSAYQADSAPGVEPVSSPAGTAAVGRTRPTAITYLKGGSVVRQLAALIGDDALRAGLHDYLTRFGGKTATLDDLLGCWSVASGRDLTGWARQWLQAPGVNTLRPELTLAPDGTIASLAIVQDPPPGRTRRISVGLYDRHGDQLRRRRRVRLEISKPRTLATELGAQCVPDVLILNDDDYDYARIRFDERSLLALSECALDMGDSLAEAVCWTVFWDMTTSAEMTAADFIGVVVRRLAAGPMPVAPDVLLQRARTAADSYAPPAQRSTLRQRLAAAVLDAAGSAQPASRGQRQLAVGFAASAETTSQLTLLRSWLAGASLPDGLSADLDLHAQILATLSARGLTTDADLDAYAAGDPVGGQVHRATCRALRPDPDAKEAAWAAALDPAQTTHLAIAYATGFWVAGQDAVLGPYRTRYFTEALPALSDDRIRVALTLTRLLYPCTPADPATLDATENYLARHDAPPPLSQALLEQAQALRQTITAQANL